VPCLLARCADVDSESDQQDTSTATEQLDMVNAHFSVINKLLIAKCEICRLCHQLTDVIALFVLSTECCGCC
jgi:uncharacterized membrane protein